jgi:protein-glutamine gamma-glutamyltransferase
MIVIDNKPLDPAALTAEYPGDSVEKVIIKILSDSTEKYAYASLEQLKFELRLRREIINAANALNRSGMDFEIFRESRCNTDFWKREEDGGFTLKRGVKASNAIRDIYKNGRKYGTECATAMQIVYYKALLEVFPEEAFNKMFQNIYLMNWHRIESELRETGLMRKAKDFLPGDRRYFANPDVDPETPEWQGENVIDLDNGFYYGHGIGKHRADEIIRALNRNRRPNAEKEAYLMDSVGRPDFKRLYALYDKALEQRVSSVVPPAAPRVAPSTAPSTAPVSSAAASTAPPTVPSTMPSATPPATTRTTTQPAPQSVP